jgi:hypothetical protein
MGGMILLTRFPSPQGGEEGPGPAGELARSYQRRQKLDALHQAILRRQQDSRQLVWDLIKGRLPLVQAAAQLRALDRRIPIREDIYRDQMRLTFPAKSLAESLCRKAIELVRQEVEDQPRWAGAVRRLETELAEHLARHGRVDFPDDPRPARVTPAAPE